jgi:ketosteroid isomerase-like protein
MFRQSWAILALVALATTLPSGRAANAAQADTIIALERAALDRWGRGDPEGYLELYADNVTYFDPSTERRVDGLQAMRKLLEPIKGRIKVDRYEMIAPHVDRAGEAAILTYNLVSHGRLGDGAPVITRWNSTAVYRLIDGRWKIFHSHWSFTKPELKAANPQ